jgi:hypothetical protein
MAFIFGKVSAGDGLVSTLALRTGMQILFFKIMSA